jgi:hypothetical protein
MTTDAINHDPAHMFMNTGSQIAGRPSMGSWVTYGLGSEAEDLPGFVVLVSTGKGRSPQPIAARQWSSGFLPSKHQGVQLRSKGDPVLYLNNPPGVSREAQGGDVEAINALNQVRAGAVNDAEVATRIAQYEMAFKMQASVPGLMDVRGESAETLALYGCEPGDGSFASNCLLARRLAERGSRFIQLYHRDWDHHSLLREEPAFRAREVDRACMGAHHGPQASRAVRRHLDRLERRIRPHPDEAGRQRPRGPRPPQQGHVHVARRGGRPRRPHPRPDRRTRLCGGGQGLHRARPARDHAPTSLGINPEAFTFKFQGLDAKLTGVEPSKVIKEILV